MFKLVFREAARVFSLRPLTRVFNPFWKERATIQTSRRPPSPFFGVREFSAAGAPFSSPGSKGVFSFFFEPFDLWSKGL